MSQAPKGVTLYRAILKAHRSRLPWDLCQLGNAYVKNEFNLHKKVTDKRNLDVFFDAWEKYLVSMQARTVKFGSDMAKKDVLSLSEEQLLTLDDLKKEAVSNSKTMVEDIPESLIPPNKRT